MAEDLLQSQRVPYLLHKVVRRECVPQEVKMHTGNVRVVAGSIQDELERVDREGSTVRVEEEIRAFVDLELSTEPAAPMQ